MYTILTSDNLAEEIAEHHLAHVDRNASVLDASKLMRQSGTTELLVTREKDGELLALGVVTAADFVTRVIAAGLDPAVLTTGDITMLQNPDEGDQSSSDYLEGSRTGSGPPL